MDSVPEYFPITEQEPEEFTAGSCSKTVQIHAECSRIRSKRCLSAEYLSSSYIPPRTADTKKLHIHHY